MESIYMQLVENIPSILFVALISYLFGSINCSIIVCKILDNKDIREFGSGNAGATNVLRNYGKRAAIITGIGDLAKSVLAVWLSELFFSSFAEISGNMEIAKSIVGFIAGFFCVLGHLYPVWFQFRGGKGVVATLGLSLVLDWRIAIVGLAVFGIIVGITKYVSLSSMLAGIAMTISTFIFRYYIDSYTIEQSVWFTALFGASLLLVILKHIPNIKRLIDGTESKTDWKKTKD